MPRFFIAGRTKTLVIIILIIIFFGGALLSTGEGLIGGFKVFWGKFDRLLSGDIF